MRNPFLEMKRFFSRKDKEKVNAEVVILKPADQVKQEGQPFYHREPPKKRYALCPIFKSSIEAKERNRRSIKTRMQKKSRIVNR